MFFNNPQPKEIIEDIVLDASLAIMVSVPIHSNLKSKDTLTTMMGARIVTLSQNIE